MKYFSKTKLLVIFAATLSACSLNSSYLSADLRSSLKKNQDLNQDNAKYVSQIIPTKMTPGDSYQVQVKVLNTGESVWTRGDYWLKSYNNPSDLWSKQIIPLDEDVPPNQSHIFLFDVKAPGEIQNASMSWRMSNENKGIFGEQTPVFSVSLN